jgi:hypothetical protein
MAFLSQVDTIVKTRIVPGVVDNVFRNSPLLAMARSKALRQYPGGPAWQENFLYDTLTPIAYDPGETFPTDSQQIITGGTVTPRFYEVPVSALLENVKVILNSPEAAFNHLDSLLQAAGFALSAKLTNDAYRHGQNVSGSDRHKFINGLDEAYNDGTTNGWDGRTYANYLTVARTDVNGALSSPMTGPAASVAGPISYPVLEQAFSSVTIGTDMPDLILTTPLGLSFVKMAFQSQQRFESVTNPDLGFKSLKFNGVDVVADQYAPGSRTASNVDTKVGYSAVAAGEVILFANTKHWRFYVSTDDLFGFGFTGFMPAQNNSTIVGHYRFSGNFTCIAPRTGRWLYAVTG